MHFSVVRLPQWPLLLCYDEAQPLVRWCPDSRCFYDHLPHIPCALAIQLWALFLYLVCLFFDLTFSNDISLCSPTPPQPQGLFLHDSALAVREAFLHVGAPVHPSQVHLIWARCHPSSPLYTLCVPPAHTIFELIPSANIYRVSVPHADLAEPLTRSYVDSPWLLPSMVPGKWWTHGKCLLNE